MDQAHCAESNEKAEARRATVSDNGNLKWAAAILHSAAFEMNAVCDWLEGSLRRIDLLGID